MNSAAREKFKEEGWRLYHNGQSAPERASGLHMIIEAHYHRNPEAPSFQIYASHWLWASQGQFDQQILNLLAARSPSPSRPRIQRGFSDWDSYGKTQYKVLD